MNKQTIGALFAGFLSLAVMPMAQSVLIDCGGGLIYDDIQDITWLQDANYAKTSGFDADGRMTWANAVAWADNLVFGGFDDWRLPITNQPDPSCSSQNTFGGAVLQGFGFNCTGSAMGHLFNVDGITAAAPGLFNNVQSRGYWSGTEFAPNPLSAWFFNFNVGNQGAVSKGGILFAWAVRPGDVVASVPEPGVVWLMGMGLAGFMGFGQRKRRL